MKEKNKNSYEFQTGFNKYTLDFDKKVSLKKIKYIEDLINDKTNNIYELIKELYMLKKSGVNTLRYSRWSLVSFNIDLATIYYIIRRNIPEFDGFKYCIENNIDYLSLDKKHHMNDIFKLYCYIDAEYLRLATELDYNNAYDGDTLINLLINDIDSLREAFNYINGII